MSKLAKGAYPLAADDALDPGDVSAWTGDPAYEAGEIPPGFKRSWTHPICERDWVIRQGFRQPVRLRDPADQRSGAEVCAFCGYPTWAGIFTRADPKEVPYPHLEESS